MPDNATDSRTQSTTDLDAGWGELIDGIDGAPAVPDPPAASPAEPQAIDEQDPCELDVAPPKRSALDTLAQMARMLDVGEGTGPVIDLRRVLAPQLEPSAPASEPGRASEPGAVSERTIITKRPRDDAPLLLELGDDAPQRVDEADDAPRMLAIAEAIPRVIEGGDESWPRRESAPVILRSAELPAARVDPAASRTAALPPVVARAQRWPWLAAAAAAVCVLGWWVTRPGAEASNGGAALVQAAASTGGRAAQRGHTAGAPPATRAEPSTPTAAPTPVVRASATPTPATTTTPAPAPTPSTAPSPTPTEASPTPTEASPTPTEASPSPAPVPSGTPEELLAAAESALADARFDDAHAQASRAWNDAHDNAALRVMALAACELHDGALARSAFRKLSGPPIRKEVYATCRARAVDVRSNVDGYTPAELLTKARLELERGEHERAYQHARTSNKLTHSAEALELMATCACHQHDAEQAAQLLPMLPRDRKRAVIEACTSAGTTLPG